MTDSSTGPDAIKRIGTYIALLGIILASGKVIWGGGVEEARVEGKIQTITERQLRDEQEFARKDVLDERLTNIEKSQQKLEGQLDRETQLLEQLRVELIKRR